MLEDPRSQTHVDAQAQFTNRQHACDTAGVQLPDLDRYLRDSRLQSALNRLSAITQFRPEQWSVLVLCSGRGSEASQLADLGFARVTASDISEAAVAYLTESDKRLEGLVLNAQDTKLKASSYDLVIVQDGLHHLPNPVSGFTEQLRLARRAALFLEPHDSFAGRLVGREWEVNGEAVNYVFRWSRRLVDQVSSSYFGSSKFVNGSYAFWHHNLLMARLLRPFGPDHSVHMARIGKRLADSVAGNLGNQFCGLVTVPDR